MENTQLTPEELEARKRALATFQAQSNRQAETNSDKLNDMNNQPFVSRVKPGKPWRDEQGNWHGF